MDQLPRELLLEILLRLLLFRKKAWRHASRFIQACRAIGGLLDPLEMGTALRMVSNWYPLDREWKLRKDPGSPFLRRLLLAKIGQRHAGEWLSTVYPALYLFSPCASVDTIMVCLYKHGWVLSMQPEQILSEMTLSHEPPAWVMRPLEKWSKWFLRRHRALCRVFGVDDALRDRPAEDDWPEERVLLGVRISFTPFQKQLQWKKGRWQTRELTWRAAYEVDGQKFNDVPQFSTVELVNHLVLAHYSRVATGRLPATELERLAATHLDH